jgi:transposase
MAYSTDLRERVISFVNKGGSRRQASARFGVNHQTVNNWMFKPVCGKPGPTAPRVDMAKLARLRDERPDALLDEMAKELNVHPSTVYRRLLALGHTLKKRGSSPK